MKRSLILAIMLIVATVANAEYMWNSRTRVWDYYEPAPGDGSSSVGGSEHVIIVSPSNGDFTSIKAALDSVTDNDSTHRYAIQVCPGIYTEAPMTLKDYVAIRSIGGRFVTKIVPSDTTSPLFTCAHLSRVEGFTIYGVTGDAAVYAGTSSAAAAIEDCTIYNCKYGVKVENGFVSINKIHTAPSGSMDYMLYCSGGTIQVNIASVLGSENIATFSYASGVSSRIGISNLYMAGNAVSTCVYGNDESTTEISNSYISNCTTGVHINRGASVSLVSTRFANTTSDLVVSDQLCDVEIVACKMNRNKMLLPDGFSNMRASFQDDFEQDQSFALWEEFAVGRAEAGKESVFGEGNSYVRGMLVYTYDPGKGTFADVSTEAASPSGSTFSTHANSSDSAIYVTSTISNGTDYVKFYGLKVEVASAAGVGSADEILAQYWNGTQWVTFNTMSTQSSGSYLSQANKLFEATGSYQVRFDSNIGSSWVANDPVSLGFESYWIRFVYAKTIAAKPVFEQFKIHSSRTEINADGFIETMGNARRRRDLGWHITDAVAWSSSPGNQDLYVLNSADGADYDIGVGRTENSFSPSARDRISIGLPLPPDIDTSCPIRIEVYWVGSSNTDGDIDWKISAGVLKSGGDITTDISTAPTAMYSGYTYHTVESIPANQANKLQSFSTSFYVDDAIGRYADGTSDVIFISLVSDGAEAADTYPGYRHVLQVRATYVSWCEGGHL